MPCSIPHTPLSEKTTKTFSPALYLHPPPRPPCLGLRCGLGRGGIPWPLRDWGCGGGVVGGRGGSCLWGARGSSCRAWASPQTSGAVGGKGGGGGGGLARKPLPLFYGGGGVVRGLGFWVGICFVSGGGVCFAVGVGVCFWLGGTFWDQGGGLGGGGAHELLAVSGGLGHVVNTAPALHLRLEDATTAGHMVGQGRQHLHTAIGCKCNCCSRDVT